MNLIQICINTSLAHSMDIPIALNLSGKLIWKHLISQGKTGKDNYRAITGYQVSTYSFE